MANQNLKRELQIKMTFRQKCESFFTSKTFSIIFIVTITTLMVIVENVGQILGFIGVLLILWSTRWNWGKFGWFKSFNRKTLIKSILATIVIILIVDVVLTPVLEIILNEPINLEDFEGLKGNLISLIISIILMWIIAAVGEELLFRGYIMKQIASCFGGTNKTWLLAVILSSVIFGFAHTYQGVTGIITAGVVAFILAMVFYRNRKNLLICILTHGIYDTFGLTMIYFDMENVFTDLITDFLHF